MNSERFSLLFRIGPSTMRLCKPVIFILLIIAPLSLSACALDPIGAATQGRLEVKGVVIDEEGNPLPDARLSYTITRRNPRTWELYDSKRGEIKVNREGRFEMSAQGAVAIYVSAALEGYYPERHHSFRHSQDGIGERVKKAVEGKEFEQPEHVEEDYVIKLEKIINPTWLDHRSGHLVSHETGGGAVFSYNPEDRKIPLSENFVREGFTQVDSLLDEEELPESGIKLIVETDPVSGKFRTFEAPTPTPGRPIGDLPVQIRLVAFGPDSGIATYTYTDSDPYATIERHMREAPEDGYQRELVLSWDDYQKLVLEAPTKQYYFFVKLNGTYGRAILTSRGYYVQEKDGQRFVSLPIGFRMQPDGSRNLEMKER